MYLSAERPTSLVKDRRYLSYKYDTVFSEGTVTHRRPNAPDEVWRNDFRIGGGGFGEVFKQIKLSPGGEPADDGTTEKASCRAVKGIPKPTHGNHKKAIMRELTTMIALRQHKDNFVELFGWYEDERQTVYIAMEYVSHGDLHSYMLADRSRTKEKSREITRQILTALDIMHRNNICHRDLKPQNILVASISPLKLKLADFGIAKSTGQDASGMRTMIGSGKYMAPEVLGVSQYRSSGVSYTKAVDTWALGMLTYELFTGSVPFSYRDNDGFDEDESESDSDDEGAPGPPMPAENTTATYRTAQTSPIVHMDLQTLAEYCKTHSGFPEETLLQALAPSSLVNFIRGLLCPNPLDRLSPSRALKHNWIVDDSKPVEHLVPAKELGDLPFANMKVVMPCLRLAPDFGF